MPCCSDTYEKLPAAPSPRFSRANAASAIASVEASVRLNSVSDDADDADDASGQRAATPDADADADEASDAERALGPRRPTKLATAKRPSATASGRVPRHVVAVLYGLITSKLMQWQHLENPRRPAQHHRDGILEQGDHLPA